MSKARSGPTSFHETESKPLKGDRQGIDYQINVGPYGWIKYDESFTRFVFPVLRRSYPRLITDNIVSVQPMRPRPVVRICCYDPEDYPSLKNEGPEPAGSIFFAKYRYGKGGPQNSKYKK
jgi:hypothetical protein